MSKLCFPGPDRDRTDCLGAATVVLEGRGGHRLHVCENCADVLVKRSRRSRKWGAGLTRVVAP